MAHTESTIIKYRVSRSTVPFTGKPGRGQRQVYGRHRAPDRLKRSAWGLRLVSTFFHFFKPRDGGKRSIDPPNLWPQDFSFLLSQFLAGRAVSKQTSNAPFTYRPPDKRPAGSLYLQGRARFRFPDYWLSSHPTSGPTSAPGPL